MLRAAKIAALLSVVFLAVAMGVFMLATVQSAKKLLTDTDALVLQTKRDEKETTEHLNQVLENVNGTAVKLREASTDEVKYWNKSVQDADKTVAAMRLFLDLTNRRFNDGVAPQLEDTIKKLGNTADEMTRLGEGLEPTLSNMAVTSLQLKNIMADPNWKKTLANVQVITDNTAQVTTKVKDVVKAKKTKLAAGLKFALDIASDIFTIVLGVR